MANTISGRRRGVYGQRTVCEVIPPATDGLDATLTCRMTYDWQGRGIHYNAPPTLDVSLSWTGVSGTTVSATADPATFRGTVETNMTVQTTTPINITSYSCEITFSFSPGVFDYLQQYAVNTVPYMYTCEPPPERHCPTSVTVSPSSGPYKAGDVLTCTSDGFPEPSYKWTDSNGVVVSTKRHVTLTNSLLRLKCTATVTVPIENTCSSDSAVVDTTGCPSSVKVSPSSAPYKAGDTLTCTSDGFPEPSYTWTDVDNGVVVSKTPQLTLTNSSFNLICTATSTVPKKCSAFAAVHNPGEGDTPISADDDGSSVNDTVIIIVVSIIGGLLVLAIVIVIILVVRYLKRRQAASKPRANENGESSLEMRSADRVGRARHGQSTMGTASQLEDDGGIVYADVRANSRPGPRSSANSQAGKWSRLDGDNYAY